MSDSYSVLLSGIVRLPAAGFRQSLCYSSGSGPDVEYKGKQMTYECRACSYKGRMFRGGVCPGCGSADIVRRTSAGGAPVGARKPYLLLLACALWLYLLVDLYRKTSG